MEYRVKEDFLAAFPKFVERPGDTFSSASDAHLKISSSILAMAGHVVGPVAVRSSLSSQPD